MAVDFEEFKNIAPERRTRELQKLINTLKKEIAEKQREIREAEHLFILADEEARLLEQMEVPETAIETTPRQKESATIEKLAGEKKEKDEKALLERLVETIPRKEELFREVAQIPIQELYSELKTVYQREKSTGVETAQDRNMIYAIAKGIEEKRKNVESGQYSPTQKSRHLLSAAEEIAQNMYRGSESYK